MVLPLDELLVDICENPEDIGLRLIYADALEEVGEVERAEFIRVQVEEYGLVCSCLPPVKHMKCRKCSLLIRARELLLVNCREWCPYYTSENGYEIILSERWFYTGTPACDFRRGFVERIVCSMGQWMRYGRQLVKEQPVLTVEIIDRSPYHNWVVTGSRNYPYAWQATTGEIEVRENYLPVRIFKNFSYEEDKYGRLSICGFRSVKAASGALSRACLRWAREYKV